MAGPKSASDPRLTATSRSSTASASLSSTAWTASCCRRVLRWCGQALGCQRSDPLGWHWPHQGTSEAASQAAPPQGLEVRAARMTTQGAATQAGRRAGCTVCQRQRMPAIVTCPPCSCQTGSPTWQSPLPPRRRLRRRLHQPAPRS